MIDSSQIPGDVVNRVAVVLLPLIIILAVLAAKAVTRGKGGDQ